MRRLRILALVNEDLIPPESMDGSSDKEIDEWKTEYDVITTLREMGHEVQVLGLSDDDHAIVSYLELMRQPYSGCNPRGLMISKDKALSKKILSYHRIPSPKFAVFPLKRKVQRPRKLQFPIFVKSVIDDASLGIAQASVVYDDRELVERVSFVHEHTRADALAEEYIAGRELYVGVIGNDRLQTLPVWELKFTKSDAPLIATRKVKWDRKYQAKLGVETDIAKNLEPLVQMQIERICKKVYNALDISGYARMDLRMRSDGRVYVLEANANPNLAYGEDFAESAEHGGISYEDLLNKIVAMGMRYRAPWKILS
jgi:D-alanine-D-alanine ligase